MDKPKSINPYQQLVRQSRKLGEIASKSYGQTVNFLTSDIASIRPPWLQSDAGQERLDNMLHCSRDILARAQTVILPNNLFPDTIVVDRTKITITQMTFFWSYNTLSIRFEDLLNIETSLGPFFGSLKISSRVMNSTDHYDINFFWRKDAIYLKHIIQGYMTIVHNKIDVSHMDKDELLSHVLELGHDPDA